MKLFGFEGREVMSRSQQGLIFEWVTAVGRGIHIDAWVLKYLVHVYTITVYRVLILLLLHLDLWMTPGLESLNFPLFDCSDPKTETLLPDQHFLKVSRDQDRSFENPRLIIAVCFRDVFSLFIVEKQYWLHMHYYFIYRKTFLFTHYHLLTFKCFSGPVISMSTWQNYSF